MKRFIIFALVLLPALLNAGVILKKSGQRLEDISIKSVTDTEIVYTTLDGTETTIPKSEVSAVLHDDGRYEEIRQQTSTPYSSDNEYSNGSDYGSAYSSDDNSSQMSWGGDATEVNVIACGVDIMKVYKVDHQYDGAKVEYRITYKGQDAEPEWTYLGTTPFAYLKSNASNNKFLNNEIRELAEIQPLAIDNFKKMKKLEFRLSKEGYATAIVSPLIQFDFNGIYYMISLNKLKPLADGAATGAVTAPEDDNQAYATQNAAKTLTREQRRQQQDSIQQAAIAAYQLEQQRKQFVADSIKQAKLEAERLAAERQQFVADSIQQAKLAEKRLAEERRKFVADSIQQAKIAHEESVKNLSRYSITKVSNREFVCNGTKLNRKEYQQLLMLNCPDAYVKYKKGTTDIAVGWTLFCLGLAGGATMYALWETTDIEETPTIIGGAASGAVLLASIPIIGTGHGRHKKALNMYNSQCVSQDAKLSLNFGATRNGMGLTLNW